MRVKKTNKRKPGKLVKYPKAEESSLAADFGIPFRLEQPIQTALYAKLYRLGYNA